MTPNYEFISYKATPTDQYMLGVATVRLFGKIILRYKHVKTKDGTGDFFTSPSYTITENTEKKYLNAFMLDSRSDEELLMEFVREGYRKSMQSQGAFSSSASVFPPAGAQSPASPEGFPF